MNIKQARQCLSLAESRMADEHLSDEIREELVHQSLDRFEIMVAPSGKFAGVLAQCRAALSAKDFIELASGITLLGLMLPRATYGEICIGTRFYLGDLPSVVFTKAANGVHLNGRLLPHAKDDQVVILISKGGVV